jgi:SH3-like domain-containing protein
MFKVFISYIFLCCFLFVHAEEYGSSTGWKLPRFVSLKSDEVNLRVGSGMKYPIVLKYTVKNLPVEIIEENNDWRKIRDIAGNEGWILEGLLQGDKFAIINQSHNESAQIYSHPKGRIIGKIGKNNVVKINSCLSHWCKIKYKNYSGWISKKNLWGIYENEKFNVSFFQPIITQIWKIKF